MNKQREDRGFRPYIGGRTLQKLERMAEGSGKTPGEIVRELIELAPEHGPTQKIRLVWSAEPTEAEKETEKTAQ
jgi:hypothetical protein